MDASVRSMVRVPRTNPKIKANMFSRLFYLWLIDIIKEAKKDDFEESDIPDAEPGHKSEPLASGLQREWEIEQESAQRNKHAPRFLKAIIAQFGLEFFIMSLVHFIKEIISIVLYPFLLQLILEYFTPASTVPPTSAMLTALALCLSSFLIGSLSVYTMQFSYQFGVRVRAACVTLIYRKSLRLSQSALSCTSSGQIINLISNDVARFELVTMMLLPTISTPILSVYLVYIVYRLEGFASFVGVASLLVVLVIQLWNARCTARYRLEVAKRADTRVRLMDEIVLGIQVIKLYAWEKPFQNIIDSARKLELKELRHASYLRGLFMFFMLFSPRICTFSTLLTLVLTQNVFVASSIFLLMTYFSILGQNLTSFATRGFAEFTECMVSIRRIQEFLLRDEFRPMIAGIRRPEEPQVSVGVEGHAPLAAVVLTGVSAKWTASGDMTLIDLNLDISEGQLVAIIGTVGSGKSSLLHLLLGELIKKEGKVELFGSVSYASQDPWIFSSSVRQNILFREQYNPSRYKAVCRACELEKDFDDLPRGDKTLVGEKGASLSGGQRARISLARAVYKKADIYLLDDPLSAVDSHVGKQLFYNCIEKFLGDKTRILVTHQVQHLSKVNHLILMENGRIQTQGTFKELRRSRHNFALCLNTPEQEKSPLQFLNVNVDTPILQRSNQRKSTRSERSISVSMAGDEIIEFEEFENDREPELLTERPSHQVYQQYLRAGVNPLFCVLVAILFIATQILVCAFDCWIAYWLHKEEDRALMDAEDKLHLSIWPSSTFMIVLGGILAGLFVIGNTRSFSYYSGCIACSHGVHTQMFKGLMNSPLSFFHNNPSGRILNRFSRDLGATDELIAKAMMDMGQAFGMVIGSLAIALWVMPWLLLPVTILATILWFARRFCIQASTNLKRIEGMARSPIYAHVVASQQGLVTIRAHSAESLLEFELRRYLDNHTSTINCFYYVLFFLSLTQDLLVNIYLTICIFSLTFFKSDISWTSAALIITQSQITLGFLSWGIKMSAEVASQMTSLERALEYTTLEPEENDADGKKMPDPSWPQFGVVEFQNVFLRYDITEPYVLRNLNLSIRPQEKVGIVGRTGAGKSSLIAALFRLAPVEGVILLDGLDTSSVTLQSLRSRLSIIPQDPVLFSGTLRSNLDPFKQYSDAELYSALHQVNLNENTSEAEVLHLQMAVTNGGGNFSVGQRQLVCLARAVLRNNKILVLDEATANVDPQTDTLLQRTIRQRFVYCTVLTVAHRLHTIIDSDRVLVMDAGTVAEFDHPHVLLRDRDSLFSRLVQQTGPAMAQQLVLIAQQNYQRKMENS